MKTLTKSALVTLVLVTATIVFTHSAQAFGFGSGMNPGFHISGKWQDSNVRKEIREKMQARHDSLASLTPEQRMQELEKMWQERETWRNEQEKAWQDFTGLTREQIEARRDSGETMGEILKSQDKTAEQTQSFLETQGLKRTERLSGKWSLTTDTAQKLKDHVFDWTKRLVNRWFGTNN